MRTVIHYYYYWQPDSGGIRVSTYAPVTGGIPLPMLVTVAPPPLAVDVLAALNRARVPHSARRVWVRWDPRNGRVYARTRRPAAGRSRWVFYSCKPGVLRDLIREDASDLLADLIRWGGGFGE